MNVSKKVNYRNFGYIPGNGLIRDLYGWLFGYRNLYKRLQARDIIKVLDVKPNDSILDIGCGRGYITIEIAKQSKKAFGVDTNPLIMDIVIPDVVKDKLTYTLITPGEPLPFEDNSMDKIFASEVIAAVADRNQFLKELKRLLKPGGKLVLCNGAGHPVIRDAYKNHSKKLSKLKRRYPDRFPETYDEYASILNKTFSNQINYFYSKDDLEEMLVHNGFATKNVSYSPGLIAGRYLSWRQFNAHLKGSGTLTQNNFILKYFIFCIIQRFDNRKYKGGILYEAINEK